GVGEEVLALPRTAFLPVIPAFLPVIPVFLPVIPAKAGIQRTPTSARMFAGLARRLPPLDPRFRGDDDGDGSPKTASPRAPRWRLVAPDQADQAALDGDAVGREEAGFVVDVGRLQRDGALAAAQALQGDFLAVDEGDDDRAVLGVVGLLDHHRIAVVDAG